MIDAYSAKNDQPNWYSSEFRRFYKGIEFLHAANSDFLTPISLQPNDVDIG